MDPKEKARRISEGHKKRLKENPELKEAFVEQAIINITKRWDKPRERKKIISEQFEVDEENLINKGDAIHIHDKKNNHWYIIVNDSERKFVAVENLISDLHNIAGALICKYNPYLDEETDLDIIYDMQIHFEEYFSEIIEPTTDIEGLAKHIQENEGWHVLMGCLPGITPDAEYKEDIETEKEKLHIYKVY